LLCAVGTGGRAARRWRRRWTDEVTDRRAPGRTSNATRSIDSPIPSRSTTFASRIHACSRAIDGGPPTGCPLRRAEPPVAHPLPHAGLPLPPATCEPPTGRPLARCTGLCVRGSLRTANARTWSHEPSKLLVRFDRCSRVLGPAAGPALLPVFLGPWLLAVGE